MGSLRFIPVIVALAAAIAVLGPIAPGQAQAQQPHVIELEVFEIESEVPRRVAQFFIQRDRLNYQQIDDQPSFIPELIRTVEEEPF